MQDNTLQFNAPNAAPTPREQIAMNKERALQPLPGVQHWLNLQGSIKTTTTVPTAAPKTISDSVVIYIDDLGTPTTKRLYVYSREAAIWNYVALT